MLSIGIAPLDWGLGHATRCVPIINVLLKNNHKVILFGDGPSGDFLQMEFPNMPFYRLKSQPISYPTDGDFAKWAVGKGALFLKSIGQEHKIFNSISNKLNLDLVISDNRYGVFSRQFASILITHQLNPILPNKLKWLSAPAKALFRYWYKPFDAIWVPDYPIENKISGSLSELPGIKPVFIGQLSRFEPIIDGIPNNKVLIVLSGPEPQRSIFEQQIVNAIAPLNQFEFTIVRGVKNMEPPKMKLTVNWVDLAYTEKLKELISEHSFFISRSGYSSLMDWLKLEKMAILVPTPGQTEQEYLAKRMQKLYNWPVIEQTDLTSNNLLFALNQKKLFLQKINFNVEKAILNNINQLMEGKTS